MVTKKKGVKKKSTKKTVKKKSGAKRKPKTKASRAKKKTKIKETVRVKTFIVEKPVYVEVPARKSAQARSRHPESFQIFDPSESRYSKDDSVNDIPDEDAEASQKFFDEGEEGDFQEDANSFEEPIEDEAVTESSHPRSRAMFSKVWWKRAFWQSAAIWLVIFLFAFFMDFANLSNVELQRNWVYLFLVIFVIMLAYQKVLKGKIVI